MKNQANSPDKKGKQASLLSSQQFDPEIANITATLQQLQQKYQGSPKKEQHYIASPKRTPRTNNHLRSQSTLESLKKTLEQDFKEKSPPRSPVRNPYRRGTPDLEIDVSSPKTPGRNNYHQRVQSAWDNLELQPTELSSLFEKDVMSYSQNKSKETTPSNRPSNALGETVAMCQRQIIHLVIFSKNKSDQEKQRTVYQIFQQLEDDLQNTQEISESAKIKKENQYLKSTIDALTDDVNKLQQKFIQQIDNHAILFKQVKQAEDDKVELEAARSEIRQLRERLGALTERQGEVKEDTISWRNPQPSPVRSYKSNRSGSKNASLRSPTTSSMSKLKSPNSRGALRSPRKTPVKTPVPRQKRAANRAQGSHPRWHSEDLYASVVQKNPSSPDRNPHGGNPNQYSSYDDTPSSDRKDSKTPAVDFLASQLLKKEGIEEQLEQLKEDFKDQKVLLNNSNKVRDDMEMELQKQKTAYLDVKAKLDKDSKAREDMEDELERQKQAYRDLKFQLDNSQNAREAIEARMSRQHQKHLEEKALIEEYMITAESMQQLTVAYISHSVPVDEAGEQALESMKQQEYVQVDHASRSTQVMDYHSLKMQVTTAHENINKLRGKLEEERDQNDRLSKHNSELNRIARKLETDIQELENADLENKKLTEVHKQELQTKIEEVAQQLFNLFSGVERKHKQLENRIVQANDIVEGKMKDISSFISVVQTSRSSESSGQQAEVEKILTDLNVQNIELKNKITIEACNRSSVEQQLTDRINCANDEIQRLISQNNELLTELERRSVSPSSVNSNFLSSRRTSGIGLLSSQRISYFPEQSFASPKATHATTYTQTDMNAADELQRSMKLEAQQERDEAQDTVRQLKETIGMMWEDVAVQENKLFYNMSNLLVQEEQKIQTSLDQTLQREQSLKDQIDMQNSQFQKIKIQNELLRMDLETQYEKANRLSVEAKQTQNMDTQEHNSVEKILDCFVGSNIELKDHLIKMQETRCKPLDSSPETSPDQKGSSKYSESHEQDNNITAFIGFLDTSEQTSSDIFTQFAFRKAMYEGITWWLIEPVEKNYNRWKEGDDLEVEGKVRLNEDADESLLKQIHEILNQQVGDILIDAIDNLLTKKDKEFISSYDLTWGSKRKKEKEEPTYELKQVISDLRKENYDYEIEQSVLKDSITSLEHELTSINKAVSKKMRNTTGDSSAFGSFRDIFVKLWQTMPIGKQETETLVRSMLSLLNYTEEEKMHIIKARTSISKPPRARDMFQTSSRFD